MKEESGRGDEDWDQEIDTALADLEGKTTNLAHSLNRQLKRIKARKIELMEGSEKLVKSVQKEVNDRLKEIEEDLDYELNRIRLDQKADIDRLQKKVGGKRDRLRREAGEQKGHTPLKQEADVAVKAREKLEADLKGLSPDIRKLHEEDFKRWIEEAKVKEEDLTTRLKNMELELEQELNLKLADYEAPLLKEIMEIEDAFRAEMSRVEKIAADKKMKVQSELDRKINQRLMRVVQENRSLIAETMDIRDKLIDAIPDASTAVLVNLLKDVMRNMAFVERKVFEIRNSREDEIKRKKLHHYQETMNIERREVEKREEKLEEERRRFLKVMEERSREIARKEMEYRADLEENFEERLKSCTLDGVSRTEEGFNRKCQDLEKEYKKRLLLYKKKLAQYKKLVEKLQQHPAAGASAASGSGPTGAFPCLNCQTRIPILSSRRPLTLKCQNCGKEYTLRAPKKPSASATAPKLPPRAMTPRNVGGDELDELPDLDGLEEETRTSVTPPPPSGFDTGNSSGKKKVICPHCEAENLVPLSLTKKTPCISCGKRIRTK